MSRALLVLDTEFQRRKAQDWVWAAKHGSRVEFKGPQRSVDQNALMWKLLTEVAQQLGWHGKRLTPDDWKLMFLDAWHREKKAELIIVPNLDNTGFVNLSTSTSDLAKDEMSELIEIIYRDGAKHGVVFSEQNSNPSDVDAPSSDGGSDGSQALPGKPQAVAADPIEPAEAADQEADGIEAQAEPVAPPASVLSPSDKAFLVRVFKTMKAAVGPDTNVFKRQAMVFTDEIGGMSDLVRAKAKTIREQLQECCGETPKTGTLVAAKYVAGVIGVDARELED